MTPEIVEAIRELQQANLNAEAALFNLHEAEKVLEACQKQENITNKLRADAERSLVLLVRGEKA